jgi:replicative DNA helicase
MRVSESETYCAAHVARSGELAPLHTAGVTAEDFAETGPYAVVSIAETLHDRGEPVTAESVRHLLRQHGVWEEMGGQEWWSVFIGRGGDGDSFQTHIRDVRAASQVRDAIGPAEEIVSVAQNGHAPREAVAEVSDLTGELLEAQASLETDVHRGGDLAAGVMDLVTSEEPANLTLATGFPRYDERFKGLINARVNVIAARTDHGKTVFADQIALNVARRYLRRDGSEKSVLVFDLENGPQAKQMRYASNLSGVPIGQIEAHAERRAALADPQLKDVHEAADLLQSLPIVVDTTAGADTQYIRSRILTEQARREVGLVVVDYLTQMGESGDGAMEQTMNAVKGLHDLAKSLGIPVLAVSQINRQPVSSSDPEPKLHHMSWSDDVAQKPAQVTTLHHYLAHWDQTSRNQAQRPDPERLGVFVRKNKGPKGPLELTFDKDCLRIYDEEDPEPYQETESPF